MALRLSKFDSVLICNVDFGAQMRSAMRCGSETTHAPGEHHDGFAILVLCFQEIGCCIFGSLVLQYDI